MQDSTENFEEGREPAEPAEYPIDVLMAAMDDGHGLTTVDPEFREAAHRAFNTTIPDLRFALLRDRERNDT